ncbi:FCPB, partial [Symbiodinium sp. CCMP2456]
MLEEDADQPPLLDGLDKRNIIKGKRKRNKVDYRAVEREIEAEERRHKVTCPPLRMLRASFVALVASACLIGGAFVSAPSSRGSGPTTLRGAVGIGRSVPEGGNGPESAAHGWCAVGAMGAVVALTLCRGKRTALRAEPLSASAAAAAAKAIAAVKGASAAKTATTAAKTAGAVAGAAKTAGAVAGSAGAGSLKQAADEASADEDYVNKKLNIMDRGTPEYEKIKEAKAKRKEKDWEVRTARNPDSTFGNPEDAYKGKADLYDPLMSLSQRFLKESGNEFNPAFQIGVTDPLGYFDPLGFCKQGDEKTFRSMRTAEIKHGRAAMMAALGAVVQHYVKLPGFEKVPAGLDAVNVAPGSYGFIALFLISGVLELAVWTESDKKAPGDFGDPLGLNKYDEEFRNRELNNGRAAMFAAIGIIAAELYTGKDAVEQLGLA